MFAPVTMYQLQPGDEGFAQGARFRLDEPDGNQYAFRTREEAEDFMARHGLLMIGEAELLALRKAPNKPP